MISICDDTIECFSYDACLINLMTQSGLIPVERIEQAIYLIRGEKVMLDRDLATLYGLETKMLKRAVRRNIYRFPKDFMFVLDDGVQKLEVPNWYLQFRSNGSSPSANGLY